LNIRSAEGGGNWFDGEQDFRLLLTVTETVFLQLQGDLIMNMIQLYIMWAGITVIFSFAALGPGVDFWKNTFVAALITAGLILTVEVVKRSKSKGPEEK
jgi:hypothetical protein